MTAQPMPREGDGQFGEDEAVNQRVAQTLDMAQVFLNAVFDDPSLLDEIPDGANVVFVPDDDEQVAAANTAAAARMRQAGKLVYLVRV